MSSDSRVKHILTFPITAPLNLKLRSNPVSGERSELLGLLQITQQAVIPRDLELHPRFNTNLCAEKQIAYVCHLRGQQAVNCASWKLNLEKEFNDTVIFLVPMPGGESFTKCTNCIFACDSRACGASAYVPSGRGILLRSQTRATGRTYRSTTVQSSGVGRRVARYQPSDTNKQALEEAVSRHCTLAPKTSSTPHGDSVRVSYPTLLPKTVSLAEIMLAQPAPFPDTEPRGITPTRGPQFNAIPPHLYQDYTTGFFNLRSGLLPVSSSVTSYDFVLADLKEMNQAFDQDTDRDFEILSEDLYSDEIN